jgi:hypothetical protein
MVRHSVCMCLASTLIFWCVCVLCRPWCEWSMYAKTPWFCVIGLEIVAMMGIVSPYFSWSCLQFRTICPHFGKKSTNRHSHNSLFWTLCNALFVQNPCFLPARLHTHRFGYLFGIGNGLKPPTAITTTIVTSSSSSSNGTLHQHLTVITKSILLHGPSTRK